MNNYYILSLKHSPVAGLAVWWRPDDKGYTTSLDEAGLYSQEQVEANPAYYNNHDSTVAIEEVAVINAARTVVEFGKVRPKDFCAKPQ